MDGPLFAAINAPVAEALLAYRSARLGAAKAIAKMNGGAKRLLGCVVTSVDRFGWAIQAVAMVVELMY